MDNNDLEACGMKCCYFLFHSEVKFVMHSSFSGERQWPFGPLVTIDFTRAPGGLNRHIYDRFHKVTEMLGYTHLPYISQGYREVWIDIFYIDIDFTR